MSDVLIKAAGAVGDQSPSQRIVADASQIFRDPEDPRKIGIRQPEILSQFRLYEAAGPDLSQNPAWINGATLLTYMVELDGVAVRQPATKREIEAMLTRLGTAGFTTLAGLIAKHFGSGDGIATDTAAAIKN